MKRFLRGLLCMAVSASFLSACAHSAQTAIPAQRSTKVLQPAPVDPGEPPPRGSTYVDTQCSAADATCAGPWQSGQTGTDTWENASPNGNGHWSQRLLCSDVPTCAAMGYDNTIAFYATTWIWNSGFGYGANVGNVDTVDTGYSPDCDPSTSDAFPAGCSIQAIANLGLHAPQGASCAGSTLATGLVPGSGPDVYANEISNIYYIKASGLAGGISTLFGWIYQTPGDGYYLQPNFSVSLSGGVPVAQIGASTTTPWVKVGSLSPSDITAGMNAIAKFMGVALPVPFAKAIASNIRMSALPCWTFPWDGTHTASKKRRT